MSESVKISVGVLAWNEEGSIEEALQSILKQTLFCQAEKLGVDVELLVIANGCTDHTVEVTAAFFEKMREQFHEGGPVELRLKEVAEAGFSNAWNLFSHTYSRRDADFLFFVNADIVIHRSTLFEEMLSSLRKDNDMHVISPLGRKHIEAANCKTIYDRLNLAVTKFTENNQSGQIRGHCFCARAKAMRSVWLPKAFPGAVDGLFKRLIISDMVSAPNTPSRIGVTEHVGYTFEAYRTLQDIFSRRVRLIVGQTYIETVIRHLKTVRAERPDLNLTGYLRARDEADPAWLHRLIQLSIHEKGLRYTMPSPWFRFRFWRNPKINVFKKIAMLPVAVLAFLFDVPVFVAAASRLKTGRVSDVWKDKQNTVDISDV